MRKAGSKGLHQLRDRAHTRRTGCTSKGPQIVVFEKTPRRSQEPLPCLRIGRYVRFNWPDVQKWLSRHQTNVRIGDADFRPTDGTQLLERIAAHATLSRRTMHAIKSFIRGLCSSYLTGMDRFRLSDAQRTHPYRSPLARRNCW